MPQVIDLSLSTPEENLALDEALLQDSERSFALQPSARKEWLRYWESTTLFVVLGVSSKLQEDVDVAACERDGVPILRRASGGGTVLQGPGCLNFSLVLSLAERPKLKDLTASYRAILQRTASELRHDELQWCGISDIATGDRKISGNAQKRTRHFVLHHGTLLYDFDIDLLTRYLKTPERQPDYRLARSHRQFCTNLPMSPIDIKSSLSKAWGARSNETEFSPPDLTPLIHEKYGRREWTERF